MITTRVRALFPQVFENGWVPIPNRDKACYLKGWNAVVVDAEQARRWSRQVKWPAIGLRVEPPLCVVDCDVPDQALMAAVRRMIGSIAPAVLDGLERVGAPPKAAFFLRYEDRQGPFRKRASRAWSHAPDEKDAPRFRIEIFGGGGGAAQIGAFGPHSHDDRGQVLRVYQWVDERSPANTRLDALPVIGRDATFAICDEADRIFKAAGLKPVKGTKLGEAKPTTLFDLTETTVFETADGETDLQGLADALRSLAVTGGPRLRVSGSFTGDSHSAGSLRCLVSFGNDGHVVIHDTKTNITHRLAGTQRPLVNTDAALLTLGRLIRGD